MLVLLPQKQEISWLKCLECLPCKFKLIPCPLKLWCNIVDVLTSHTFCCCPAHPKMERRESWSDRVIWYSRNLRRVGEGRVFISDRLGPVHFTARTPRQVLYPSTWLSDQLWWWLSWQWKMNVTPCRMDQQQSSWMSHQRVLPEDERRELRIWMRRKQRESLAVYQKHRESLRERERKPFPTSGTAVSYVWLFVKMYSPLFHF